MLAFKGNHGVQLEKGVFISVYKCYCCMINSNISLAGLLIRDPRMVERKKPGQKKARKKFAWYVMCIHNQFQ